MAPKPGMAPTGPPPPAVLKSTAVVVGAIPALHQQSQPMQSKIKMEGGISTVGAVPPAAMSRSMSPATAAAPAGGEQRPAAPAAVKQQP